jgi:hypothetical protein
VVGNFGVVSNTVTLQFAKTGTWYEYFSETSYQVTSTSQSVVLAPGEFRLYSTQNFAKPPIVTEVETITKPEAGFVVWPNPVSDILKISSSAPLSRIVVYSMSGSKMKELTLTGTESAGRELFLGDLAKGNYLIQVIGKNGKAESRKIIKY